jgi:predicted nucleic acid-binding protein
VIVRNGAACVRESVVLVDTSVWIEVFRRKAPFRLESVLSFDEIVTCLPVVQEVLQGFRDEAAFRLARDSMLALPIVESPLRAEVFEEAVQLYRAARRAGRTVRSGVDCVIGACAIRHGLSVLHRDRDFAALAAVSPLRARAIHR